MNTKLDKYLSNESNLQNKNRREVPDEVQRPFVPFIHGTNTSIFSTLPRTNFQLMSPLEMIDNYQTVPMTGEINQGGYAVIGSEPIKDEKMGKTSFGIISANGINDYTLNKIIENYAQPRGRNVTSKQEALRQFKSEMENGFSSMFSNINLMIIYLARARHMHDSLDEIISAAELKTLQDNFNDVEQFYCFFQLIGTYIHPNFELLVLETESGIKITKPDYKDAIKTLLTFEHIVDKIKQNQLDMKSILANPTEENLAKALTVLELPQICTVKTWRGEDKKVVLPCTQFFCLEAYPFKIRDEYQPDSFLIMSKNRNHSGFKFNDILSAFADGCASTSYFEEVTKQAKNLLIAFHDRIRVFNKLVQTPQNQFKLTHLQEHFLAKDYPLILLSDATDKIELDIEDYAEYRSNTALKIGIDITIMATDTQEHRLEIMQFLELHQIRNVQVILFSDLEFIKSTKEKPKTPYHHKDGMPTLKWLAAKQIAASGTVYSKAATANASQQSLEQAIDLLKDAQEYQAMGATLQSLDANIQTAPVVASEQTLTPIATVISSLKDEVRTSETNGILGEGLSFNVLSGVMLVLGVAAVALAFILLNAASLNVAGLLVAGVGIAITLAGIGMFASNQCKSSDNYFINRLDPVP